MTKYLIVSTQQYSENTADYGFGDYPEHIPFLICVVESETRRKAQNAAKRQFPNLMFSGQFGDQIFAVDTDEGRQRAARYTAPADLRLSWKAQNVHNAARTKISETDLREVS
jgi:hypothetical protein